MVTKREIEEVTTENADQSLLSRKDLKSATKETVSSTPIELRDNEMGELEEGWEDAVYEDDEDEGEVIFAEDSEDEEMDADGNVVSKSAEDMVEDEDQEADEKVYLPGQELDKEEVLVPDNSAYECLHTLNVEWPCLTFDILRDQLGSNRTTFPMTTYLVSGSQADKAKDNKIYIMKMSQLHKTKHDDDEDGMDENSDDENDLDEDAILEYKTVNHFGSVNRIRVMPHLENHVVATWSETGKVHIYDLTAHVQALDTPGMIPPKDTKPYYTNHKHGRYEGYGLDWSPVDMGKLLSGDTNGKVYLTQANGAVFSTDDQPFVGHKDSVEDIQWSPSERSVFATCSVDKTIKIWDTRTKKKPHLSIVAHDTDVNVISWNRYVLFLFGGNDGEKGGMRYPLHKTIMPPSNVNDPWMPVSFERRNRHEV